MREEARRTDLKTEHFQVSSGRGQGPLGGASVGGGERKLWGAGSGEGHANQIVGTLLLWLLPSQLYLRGGVGWTMGRV